MIAGSKPSSKMRAAYASNGEHGIAKEKYLSAATLQFSEHNTHLIKFSVAGDYIL